MSALLLNASLGASSPQTPSFRLFSWFWLFLCNDSRDDVRMMSSSFSTCTWNTASNNHFERQTWIKIGDHVKGAHLLIRVCRNISRFPARESLAVSVFLMSCYSFVWFHSMFSMFSESVLSYAYPSRLQSWLSRTHVMWRLHLKQEVEYYSVSWHSFLLLPFVFDFLISSMFSSRVCCVFHPLLFSCKTDSVAILTSAVIECTRASMLKQAVEFAIILMKPENRDLIDVKFKKKIENLVRKSAGTTKSTEEGESISLSDSSSCPFCLQDVVETELSCSSCKNSLPFCIASGNHVSRSGLTFCPHCKFPAMLAYWGRLLSEGESSCPMCSKVVTQEDLLEASTLSVDAFLSWFKESS